MFFSIVVTKLIEITFVEEAIICKVLNFWKQKIKKKGKLDIKTMFLHFFASSFLYVGAGCCLKNLVNDNNNYYN